MPTLSDSALLGIYEAALKPRERTWRRLLQRIWTAVGLSLLIVMAWGEPFSRTFFDWAKASGAAPFWTDWVGMPLVLSLRAVLLVESFGYVYHRFFQHLGVMTRLSAIFRRNQMFHWVHHMVIYPIGRLYRSHLPYVASETGIAWSWTGPAVLGAAVTVAVLGWSAQAVIFTTAFALYAKFIIDVTHSRFHEIDHPWASKEYFQWLESIHLLHHWDQRYNFTIVHPLMDRLFGSYLSPEDHPKELEACLGDSELTVSDLINWRYLLLEATPAEYAAFISQARRHSRSMRKMDRLLELLSLRVERLPEDEEAGELCGRAVDLVNAVRKQSLGVLVS